MNGIRQMKGCEWKHRNESKMLYVWKSEREREKKIQRANKMGIERNENEIKIKLFHFMHLGIKFD